MSFSHLPSLGRLVQHAKNIFWITWIVLFSSKKLYSSSMSPPLSQFIRQFSCLKNNTMIKNIILSQILIHCTVLSVSRLTCLHAQVKEPNNWPQTTVFVDIFKLFTTSSTILAPENKLNDMPWWLQTRRTAWCHCIHTATQNCSHFLSVIWWK